VKQTWVEAGCFDQGSHPLENWHVEANETPRHGTCLTAGFWMDQYEVSNAQYQEFVAAGGYLQRQFWSADGWLWKGDITGPQPVPDDFSTNRQPRVWVTWYEADAYARWRGGRLPSEAEWEYAARGPKSLRFPWGDEWLPQRANTSELGVRRTMPVDEALEGRSWCGAEDLAGNVWEWTNDWFDARYYRRAPRDDPRGPLAGERRVLRGGSWGGDWTSARSPRRAADRPGFRSLALGLRTVSGDGSVLLK
jgi:iron(II)-dependent oxidoreductase